MAFALSVKHKQRRRNYVDPTLFRRVVASAYFFSGRFPHHLIVLPDIPRSEGERRLGEVELAHVLYIPHSLVWFGSCHSQKRAQTLCSTPI